MTAMQQKVTHGAIQLGVSTLWPAQRTDERQQRGPRLTSACSSTLAGVLVQRAASVHHRAMPMFNGSAGVLLKRSVRPRTVLT